MVATTDRRTKAEQLAAAAQSAAEVRAYDTDPNVIAYRVERTRAWVDRLIWVGLIMGLLFTMTNVQSFAAGDSHKFEPVWWAAWLLDPMVSLVLVGVLLGEQVAARYEIRPGVWVRFTKWVSLGMTYAMNTWESWAIGDPAKILLHSVPVVLVFCAAEAVTDVRHAITRAVTAVVEASAGRPPGAVAEPSAPVAERSAEPTDQTTTADRSFPVSSDRSPQPVADDRPVAGDRSPVADDRPVAERSFPVSSDRSPEMADDRSPVARPVAPSTGDRSPVARPVARAAARPVADRSPEMADDRPRKTAQDVELSTRDRARLALAKNPALNGAELARELGVSPERGRTLLRELRREREAQDAAREAEVIHLPAAVND